MGHSSTVSAVLSISFPFSNLQYTDALSSFYTVQEFVRISFDIGDLGQELTCAVVLPNLLLFSQQLVDQYLLPDSQLEETQKTSGEKKSKKEKYFLYQKDLSLLTLRNHRIYSGAT